MKFNKKSILLFICLLLSTLSYSQEICNNGIDDDADGLVDMNDSTNCSCTPTTTAVPSLIPNASFETMACCPSTYSQASCAQGWIQATSATSDYMNTCGMVFPAATSAGLVPFPDGNGILGCIFSPGWQEYVGSCLTSPMLAGTPYQLTMNIASTPIDNFGGVCNGGTIDFGPIDIVIYGTTNCASMPVGTTGCPGGPWVVLGTANYSPSGTWGTITFNFTPAANINVIMIGSPCALPASYSPPSGCYPYFYFDNLILNTTSAFTSAVTQTGTWCANNIQLSGSAVAGATYQWYLNGVAIVGQTALTLNVSTGGFPAGNYSIVTTSAGTCAVASTTVVAPAPPVSNAGINVTICSGTIGNLGTATTAGYTYVWSSTTGLSSSTISNPTVTLTNGTASPVTSTYTVTTTETTTGCVSTDLVDVTVNPLATANAGPPQTICSGIGAASALAGTVGGGATTGTWSGGGGTYSPNNSTLNANYTPSAAEETAGTVTLTLTTNDPAGPCVAATSTITITINPKPLANFTAPNVCQYDIAFFNDMSTVTSGTIIDWDWTVAPATFINNTQNPNYFYGAPGLYNVQLIVTTNLNCTDTIIQPINIWNVPVAAYTVNDVCLGDFSVYNNTSNIGAGIISTYTWDFGDPAFPNNGLQNPQIAYTIDGIYNSQLIVTSNNNCVDTAVYTFNVWPMPNINFTVDTLTACWPFTADFTNTTVINSGTISTYTWDLNFGSTSNNINESIMYPNIYSQYTITLSAVSNQGCDTIITRPNYITVYPKPTADFTVDAPCLGDFSTFQDNSSVSSGTISIYDWNFNNASVPNSALQNPKIAYPNDGTFNVELVTTTNYGCQDSITKMATVWPMPNIDFTAGPLVGCYPFMVVFDNLTVINSGTVQYTWDLDDGNGLINSFEPSIMYPNFENTYTITLNAISNQGCDTSITKPNYIIVHPKPTASFTYTPTDLDIIHNVIRTINLSVLADNYFWDFGTGDYSSNFEDYYQYTGDTGIYIITLVTTTNFGCVDTADAIVYIKPIFTIYIPNSFTPNEDGLNDFFMVFGHNLKDVKMYIFDRWGENVATISGLDPMTKGWDGIFHQQPAKQDVYVYRIEVIDIFGDFHEYMGQVNLLR